MLSFRGPVDARARPRHVARRREWYESHAHHHPPFLSLFLLLWMQVLSCWPGMMMAFFSPVSACNRCFALARALLPLLTSQPPRVGGGKAAGASAAGLASVSDREARLKKRRRRRARDNTNKYWTVSPMVNAGTIWFVCGPFPPVLCQPPSLSGLTCPPTHPLVAFALACNSARPTAPLSRAVHCVAPTAAPVCEPA